MITSKVLEDFFSNTRNLREEGRTSIDVDGECRWSFFFIDSEESRLLALGHQLVRQGYELVGLLHPAPGDDDQTTICLRVDRVEAHSIGSLTERTEQLYAIARDAGVHDYDGMDVGLVDGH